MTKTISLSRFALALALVLSMASLASAETSIRFTLDWKFEGPVAPYLLAESKGYFDAEGLDVSIDSGNGSAGAVNRVASGAYDIGFADINAMIEFNANNPDKALKAVFMVYDHPPFSIFTKNDSGITEPADFAGKVLGAPVFDAARKTFPAFCQATGLDKDSVTWLSMDPALREPMLVKGEVDAISGYYFTSLLNLENAGVPADELVVFKYADYGVNLYGNAIIVTPEMAAKPEVVKGFLRAVTKGWAEAVADPEAAIAYVKERDGLIDVALETKRLELAVDANVKTDYTVANGIGGVDMERLDKAIDEVAISFGLEATPEPEAVFDDAYLPAKDARMIF
jgi:NitT/TauT family transport system substrate-binding protein